MSSAIFVSKETFTTNKNPAKTGTIQKNKGPPPSVRANVLLRLQVVPMTP